jgi:transglutaminase-like putative cysteine protease
MKHRVTHTTRYTGSESVSVGHNQAWLRPRLTPRQQCERHRISVSPKPSTRSERTDYFGNHVFAFSFNRGYDALTVTSKSDVVVEPRELPDAEAAPAWERVREGVRTPPDEESAAALQFVFDSPRIAADSVELRAYAAESFPSERPILAAVADLTARIHRDFEYRPQSTTVTTPVAEVFRNRLGVCQDFAHLQIAALRSLGLPARYVSGYLRTRPPEGQPRLVGADASHAWLSVFCGTELGWVDVDPTNALFVSDEHITVAWGRDYADVPPLRGVYIGGGAHSLEVNVDVAPLE